MTTNNYYMIADYDFWIKLNEWDIEQMTALLLGYNPLYFDNKLIQELCNGTAETSMSQENVKILVHEYKEMYALIMDAIKTGSLKAHSSPWECYKWIQANQIPTFKEFHQAIQNNKVHSKNKDLGIGLNAKREQQYKKIILSFAIKCKFHPENLKNPSTAKFRDAIERSGLTIDDNTIREVVRASYETFKDRIDHSVFND